MTAHRPRPCLRSMPAPVTPHASSWERPSDAAGARCCARRPRSQLIRQNPGIDVTVVAHRRPAHTAGATSARHGAEPARACAGIATAGRLRSTAACTAISFAMFGHFELVNLAMVYLLGVVIAGLRFGRGPSVLTSVANVIVFDFCFVPPRFSLAVSDAQYLITFGVMLTVALVIANLTASVRQQTRVAGARERRTALLYAMSRELAATAWHLQHGAGRGPARCRGVPVSRGDPAAGCHGETAATTRSAARAVLSRRGPGGCAVGCRSRSARRHGLGHPAGSPRAVPAAG